MAYSMSVLAPESGVGGHYLSKSEMKELLGLAHADSRDSLLQEIMTSIKQGHSVRPT